jgi:hypothetical protein
VLVAIDTVARHRTRKLYVLKSRGMEISDEVREFRFTSKGIELTPSRRKTKRRARSAA